MKSFVFYGKNNQCSIIAAFVIPYLLALKPGPLFFQPDLLLGPYSNQLLFKLGRLLFSK